MFELGDIKRELKLCILEEAEDGTAVVDGRYILQRAAEHFIQQVLAASCFHVVEQMIHGALPEFSQQVQFIHCLLV